MVYTLELQILNIIFDYKKEDISYVARGWWSYAVYTMSKAKNCINPLTLEYISGLIFETPFFLKLASAIGFNVPKYNFSLCCDELKEIFYKNANKKYITQNTLTPNTNFKASNTIDEQVIGLVEYIKGTPIFLCIL